MDFFRKIINWIKQKQIIFLVILIFILFLFNVGLYLKKALALDLYLPHKQIKAIWETEYFTYSLGRGYLTLSNLFPFTGYIKDQFPVSNYGPIGSIRPWILRKFLLTIQGGSEAPITIPYKMVLTNYKYLDWSFKYYSFAGDKAGIYLRGWTPPGCYTIGCVQHSFGFFSGWDILPAGVSLSMIAKGLGGFEFYNSNDEVFLSHLDFGSSWMSIDKPFYQLKDSLKSIFVWGGTQDISGYFHFAVNPQCHLKDLSILINSSKVYEKKGAIVGSQEIDIAQSINDLFPRALITTPELVRLPMKILIHDEKGKETNTKVDFSIRAFWPEEPILLESNKPLKVTSIDSESQQIIETKEIGKIKKEIVATERNSFVIEDPTSKDKLELFNVDTTLFNECQIKIESSLSPDLTEKTYNIEVLPEVFWGEMNFIQFDFSDLKIKPETLKLLKCDNGICNYLSAEINEKEKTVRLPIGKKDLEEIPNVF